MSLPPPENGTSAGDRERVYSGLKWVALAMVLLRCTRFLTTVVLTYILAREVIAEVMMAMAVVMSLAVVREFGFGQAYVQLETESEEEADRARDTTFGLCLVTNLVLFVGVYSAAPWFAAHYPDYPQMGAVLRGVFWILVIDAFATTPGFVLQKEMRFKALSSAEMAGGVANAAIAIGMAVAGMGIWSLVAGLLGARLVQTVQLYRFAGYRPRWRLDRKIAGQLFGFGKYMWGFAALSALGANFDKLVMGKYPELAPPAQVAMYGIALNLCLLPATQISFLVGRIAFPALTRIRDDVAELHRAFLKALNHVTVLAVPVGLGLWAVADDFVMAVYPSAYAEMAAIIGVLSFYGMVMAVASISGPVFQAVGRPRVLFRTSLVHHAILFPLVCALIDYGVIGVAIAVTVPLCISAAIGFLLVARLLDLAPMAIVWPIVRTAIAGAIMMLAVGGLRAFVGPTVGPSDAWLRLAASILVGAGVYLAAIWIIHRDVLRDFTSTLRRTAVASGGS